MIHLAIRGGLGNQLFQYAAARQLALTHETDLIIDTSYYQNQGQDTPRTFLLEQYPIKAIISARQPWWYWGLNKLAHFWPSSLLAGFFYKEKSPAFDAAVLDLPDGSWLTGYFQSEKYFYKQARLIRQELTLNSPLTLAPQGVPVFIHVRRGDYVENEKTNQYHGLCSLDYYERAVDFIRSRVSNPHFYIFSDDINWTMDHLVLEDATYVSAMNFQDFEELAIMSACAHGIIANSSFSWWGAWLIDNPDKIIVAPARWFQQTGLDDQDIVPTSWHRL